MAVQHKENHLAPLWVLYSAVARDLINFEIKATLAVGRSMVLYIPNIGSE